MRTISTPTTNAAAAGVNQPCYLVQIDWPGLTSRLCSHSTQTWNGQTWSGAGIEVSGWDALGAPSQITLADADYAWRTLVLGYGIRDRAVSIWKAFVGALDVSDPVALYAGYGDQAVIVDQQVTIRLGGNVSGRTFSPRERIGPAIGVNFTAPPNLRIKWNGQEITFTEAR